MEVEEAAYSQYRSSRETQEVEEVSYSHHRSPREAHSVENRMCGREVARKGEQEEEEEEEEEETEEGQEASLQAVSSELCEPYYPNTSIHQ